MSIMKITISIIFLMIVASAHQTQEHPTNEYIHNSHSHEDHDHRHDHHDHTHSENSGPKDSAKAEYQAKAEQIRRKYNEDLDSQTNEIKVTTFFESCSEEVGQWWSLPTNFTLKQALEQCFAIKYSGEMVLFYEQLSTLGRHFSKEHIELLVVLFRRHKNVAPVLRCLAAQRQYENKFFGEKKKYKYLGDFVKNHPQHLEQVFPEHRNYSLKGQRTCNFLKIFFQYYYIEVVSSLETLSSTFIRALTVRSSIFDHYDISYCISLDSMGSLSEALDNIDINNIYLKIPEVFKQLKYLKLKDQCKDEENIRLLRSLREALQGMDMFQIMFNDYEPFVEIATEKFGQTQIRILASMFADMIANRERYLQLSKEQIQDPHLKKNNNMESKQL